MSRLLILSEGASDWSVWFSLDEHDPITDPFGFCIGTGQTRAAAIEDAIEDLGAAIDQLRSPDGTIEERQQMEADE